MSVPPPPPPRQRSAFGAGFSGCLGVFVAGIFILVVLLVIANIVS